MKLTHKLFGMALAAGALLNSGGAVFAADRYETLAKEIAEAGDSINNKKIAIIPFSYADGRSATKDGSVISERITMKLIKLRKFEIVERSMLDKVMGELKLQNSGMMDAASTQQLGKLLGVEAIVTGTLVEMQAGKIEVNARLIKTETAQAIGAAQMTVEKDWVGDAATPQEQAQPQAQQPGYYQPPAQQAGYYQPAAPAPRVRGKYEFGFFEFFYGFGAPKMNLEFSNTNANIVPVTELGIVCPSCGARAYRTVTFEGLKTGGFGPLGLRVGGFSNTIIGGDFELSYEKRNIAAQGTTWSLNGGAPATFTFSSNDYATVKTFGMSFDLLLRIPGEVVNPYTGIGLGLSMNTIDLPNVWGANRAAPASEFSPGLMVRLPIGVRFRLHNHMSLFTEFRYESNSMTFDRGFEGESDSILLKGTRFLVGLGVTF
jgi:TolB-like protein